MTGFARWLWRMAWPLAVMPAFAQVAPPSLSDDEAALAVVTPLEAETTAGAAAKTATRVEPHTEAITVVPGSPEPPREELQVTAAPEREPRLGSDVSATGSGEPVAEAQAATDPPPGEAPESASESEARAASDPLGEPEQPPEAAAPQAPAPEEEEARARKPEPVPVMEPAGAGVAEAECAAPPCATSFPPRRPGGEEGPDPETLLETEHKKAARGTRSPASPPPATSLFSGLETDCPSEAPSGPIDLAEVVTRALCSDPRTRESWASARARAARVGIERAAFLPTASASLDISSTHLRESEKVTLTDEETDSKRDVTLTNSSTDTVRGASLDFAWLLFDFGQQKAVVETARQMLLAATAIHNAVVQTVFLEAASAYYALSNAQTALALEKERELFSLRTLAKVEAQNEEGADTDVDEIDMLQAKSTAAEATLDRVRAEGALHEARGELAVLLGLSPAVELTAGDVDDPSPEQEVVRSIGDLLEQARASHPAIRAAHAEVLAARANVDSVSRFYRPTLRLVQENRREYDGIDRWENRVGLQLSIPLYEPSHRNRKHEAQAEVDAARAEVQNVEQAVALEVWLAFQSLKTETIALEQTRPLIDTARKLLTMEQDLFVAGEGDMLDLIFAQKAVADARREHLDALSAWRTARLRLAASLGELGFWTIGDPTKQ